jgi:DNA polymerase (family 10)
MVIGNRDIAAAFEKMADLLDIQGANQFRVRSYRNAARTIAGWSATIAGMVSRGEDLAVIPGVGKDLAGKIIEIARTGSFRQLAELEKAVDPALRELMRVPSLGPRRIQLLNKTLNIRSLDDLEQAAVHHRIRKVPGMGKQTEQKVLADIRRIRDRGDEKRFLWMEAEQIVFPLMQYLQDAPGIGKITVAGSFRRRFETVGDLDILATCDQSRGVMGYFTAYDSIEQVISRGGTRSTVMLRAGMQVDLRLVPDESYGAALHYFTGSKAHNVAVRMRGVRQGLKINEYGVFKGEERVAGRTEEEVFAQVGLPFLQPELREDRGELETALNGELPRLIEPADIRGDLQMHTSETDGKLGIREMAAAAEDLGYEYIAVTDHSKRVAMARGLGEERLARQIEEIDRFNSGPGSIRVLKSIEVDILPDGSLDLPDTILKELDLVVAAVHYNRNMSREQMTDRVIRAMDNPYVTILAHPTGRILLKRDPFEIDLERVMRAAVERGCHLELNADPHRLDLSDVYCRTAKDLGVKLAVSTDAHSAGGLQFMKYGIAQARRGWLEPGDVLNTRPWAELQKLLKR